jgi:hypothetical protein
LSSSTEISKSKLGITVTSVKLSIARKNLEGSAPALPKNLGTSGDVPSSQNPFHRSLIASRHPLPFTLYDTNLFGADAPPTNHLLIAIR